MALRQTTQVYCAISHFKVTSEENNMCKYCAILLLAIAIKRKKRRKRRLWCKKWYMNREKLGQNKLLKELEFSSESDYKNYVRMSKDSFEELLVKVAPLIKKQDTLLRKAIPARHRLALTLRYLASGINFEDLKFLTAIAPQTIGKIVFETCKAIIEVLQDFIVLPVSEEDWKKQADAFYHRWNFPNCIGAVGGKHVAIKKNYSIILMGVVNVNYEFVMVDIGTYGRDSDSEIFNDSLFFSKLNKNELKIPIQESPPGCDTALPYVFVADDAFPLMENIMTPFSQASTTKNEIIFNYRLSRAREVVENAFEILTSRFRILLKTINLSPEKATTIALTCCYLHNFLRKKSDQTYSSCGNLATNTDTDVITETISIPKLNRTVIRNASNNANDIRNQFCAYFDSVACQSDIYEKLTNKNVNDSAN